MSAVPVIPVTPSEPAWLQAAIANINAELAAGSLSVSQLLQQIAALEQRIIANATNPQGEHHNG